MGARILTVCALLAAVAVVGPVRSAGSAPVTNDVAWVFGENENADLYVTTSTPGGAQIRLTEHPAFERTPVFSPDGSLLAFVSNRDSMTTDIYTIDPATLIVTRLTTHTKTDSSPDWSPDGTKIVFETGRYGSGTELATMNPDGTGVARLTTLTGADTEPAWSPAGDKIAWVSTSPGRRELFVMNADGSGVTRLTDTAGSEREPDWSPDGTRIVFARNGTMFVRTLATGAEARIPAPTAKYEHPVFGPGGTEVIVSSNLDGDMDLYRVVVATGALTQLTNNPAIDEMPDWYAPPAP